MKPMTPKLPENLISVDDFLKFAKPYLDARNLLRQAENYTHFAEIQERYEQIKASAATVEA